MITLPLAYRQRLHGVPWSLRDPLLPERLLAKLWRAKEGRRLRTTDGRSLSVLYAGRPAPGHGPDFRDAVLDLDGEPLRGDVEIHRRPRDWTVHGHQRDTAYDGVVLHVVGTPAKGPPSATGGPALSVVIDDARGADHEQSPSGSFWSLQRHSESAVRAALRRAGLARLHARAKEARRRIEASGLEQATYALIMEALGYAENRAPFLELASLLPVALLRAVTRSRPYQRRLDLLERLLLSASGLAPATPEWWAIVGAEPMRSEAWRRSGVRPSNHPGKRIRGAASLLARHLPLRLIDSLASAVKAGPAVLLAALTVEGRSSAPALIGQDRACEIAVNAVLPSLIACAASGDGHALRQTCLRTYAALPAPQDNTITREARRLLGLSRAQFTACEQQGLLGLYRGIVKGD